MRYEFYKLFVKRHGWLLILIFALLRIVTVFLQPNYVRDYKMEMYREAYMKHMEVLEGKLDEEKKSYISEQNKIITELLGQDTSVEDYVSGRITEEEFNDRYSRRNMSYQLQSEFEPINERYQRVLQDPERVYFIYENGWTALIGNENLDFVLLILLMLLFVPMICSEFSTDMYPILRTTPNGGARLFASKFAVGMVTAVLSAVVMFAVEVVYFSAMFGLPSGSFPVQSLSPFAESTYEISIFGAAVLTLVNRCLGAMFMAAILLCLSAILRRSLSAIFIGTLTIILPFILFSKSVNKYLFPTPLGFLLSSGFLRGTFPVIPTSPDLVTITPRQYITLICTAAVIILVLFIVGMAAFCGMKIRIMGRRSLACMLCIPMIFMTGCSKEAAPDLSGFTYDKWSYEPTCEEFSVVRDDSGAACILRNGSDTPEPIIRDCFTDATDFILATMFYIDGETLYYLNQYSSYHYEIIALDTRDFSEQSVHEVKWSDNIEEMDMLFGLGFYLPKKMQQDEWVYSFFVHGEQLFISKSGGIFWYDLRSGKEICIYDKKGDDLAFYGGCVYYTDELLDVYRYDVDSRRNEKLPVGKAERIYADDSGLYCRDLLDGKLYQISPDGSKSPSDHYFKEVSQ